LPRSAQESASGLGSACDTMGGTHCYIKTIVRDSARYHSKRWNVLLISSFSFRWDTSVSPFFVLFSGIGVLRQAKLVWRLSQSSAAAHVAYPTGDRIFIPCTDVDQWLEGDRLTAPGGADQCSTLLLLLEI
jgi:hypothetical protein